MITTITTIISATFIITNFIILEPYAESTHSSTIGEGTLHMLIFRLQVII